MPNIKSQIKRDQTNELARQRNAAAKSKAKMESLPKTMLTAKSPTYKKLSLI